MAKRITRYLTVLLTLGVLLCGTAQAVGVEQIQVSLPRVDVYLHAETEPLQELRQEEITATLNGKALEVEDFQPSDQGIFYIFMLDVSKSIPTGHLEAAKQAVRDTCENLREQDKLALLTFGSDVKVLSNGDEERAAVLEKLDALACTDNHTKFYDAMDTLVEMATQVTDMRRIAVVMSDGIDDTDAGMSQAALENVLQQSGIAVYALCIDTAPPSSMAQFQSFIRLSGGELYPYGAQNAERVLSQLLDRLDNVWMLQLLCTAPQEAPGAVPLEIRLGTISTVTAELEPDYWVPDETPPYVTAASLDAAAHAVTVSFSEPVEGGADVVCYALTDSRDQPLEIDSIAYVGVDRRTVRLIVPQLDGAAAYNLSVSGPVDLSAGKNPLISYHAALGAELMGVEPETETPTEAPRQETAADLKAELRNLVLLTILALAAVAGLIVLILRFHGSGEAPAKSAKPVKKRTHKLEPSTKARKKDHSAVKFIFAEDETKKEK